MCKFYFLKKLQLQETKQNEQKIRKSVFKNAFNMQDRSFFASLRFKDIPKDMCKSQNGISFKTVFKDSLSQMILPHKNHKNVFSDLHLNRPSKLSCTVFNICIILSYSLHPTLKVGVD